MIFALLAFLFSLNGPLTCQFHEQNLSDDERIFVQTFKKTLLKEMGFSSVPNVSMIKAPKIPSFYKRLIEAENSKPIQTSELEEDDFHAKTNQLFLFSEQGKFFKRKTSNFVTLSPRKKLIQNRSRNVTAWFAHAGYVERYFLNLSFASVS